MSRGLERNCFFVFFLSENFFFLFLCPCFLEKEACLNGQKDYVLPIGRPVYIYIYIYIYIVYKLLYIYSIYIVYI